MILKDIMTTSYAVLHSQDSIRKAVSLLRATRLDGIPVLGEDENLIGVFSRTNLYDLLIKGIDLGESINPYITRTPVVADMNTPYKEVSEIVKKSPVGMGIVIDEDCEVVGLLTKVDMIMALFKREQVLNTELRAMYDTMHSGVVSVDRDGMICFANRAAEEMLHLSADDLLGQLAEKALPFLDFTPSIKHSHVIKGQRCYINEKTLIVNYIPLDNEESLSGCMAIFQDITDFEQVAQELESVKSLNRTLDTVLQIAYDGIVVVDHVGKITLVNDTFSRFFNRVRHELLGHDIQEIVENSRLHIVARTGVAELNDIQAIRGKNYVVSRLPIIKENQVIGAVGKLSLGQPEELKQLAERLECMGSQLSYYRNELNKMRKKPSLCCFEEIIAVSPQMQEVQEEARQAAKGRSSVLLLGESGTGKDLLAQAIHMESSRRNMPFIKINCAAIPEPLLESELFGYAPGAFTGAQKKGKPGRFEMANKGTILLDEIGDMPLPLQVKLLGVLEEMAFEPIGSTSTVNVDVRILAATNQDLEELIKHGRFREDLYYRLQVIPIRVLPLRQRKEDILPLAYHFLDKYRLILGQNIRDFSKRALFLLENYYWPGNVRELENVVERAVNFANEGLIEEKHLPSAVHQYFSSKNSKQSIVNNLGPEYYRQHVNEAENQAVKTALQATGGNKKKAAELLGISRSWLYAKLKEIETSSEGPKL